MTRYLDPARDDAGVRLRMLRLRRGMSQAALAELACVSSSFVSMVETGQRELTRVCDVVALADALRVSPLYLADGRLDAAAAGHRPIWTVPFPARCDPITLTRHHELGRQFLQLVRQDGRTTGDWLRRLAREPGVDPWLLLDQLATCTRDPGHPGIGPLMNGTHSPARSGDRWFAVVDGAQLRRLRRQRGLSAAELARKAGIGLSTVIRLERQHQGRCRTRTLVRLAAALGRSPAILTPGQPPPGQAATSRLRR